MALGADPDYLFARLLHQACNEGLDPESIRRCLRAERTDRTGVEAEQPAGPDRSTPRDVAEPPGTSNRHAAQGTHGGDRGTARRRASPRGE